MFNAIGVSKRIGVAVLAVAAVALLMSSSSPLQAQTLPDKAVVTFDRPVEVPGKVLPPGTYVFKSLEANGLVQIFNQTEQQLFATVVVVPEDRTIADVDCYVQLLKTRSDAPQEVQGFFMPGRLTGLSFVYPETTAHHRHG